MKPDSCKACPYYNRKGPVWGQGASSAKLAIVGQSPGLDEVDYYDQEHNVLGVPFVGASGRIFNRSLSAGNIERSREFVTNVVKCFVASREPLDPRAVSCCRPLIEKELGLLPRLNTILAVGQSAFNALTGKELHLVHTRAKEGTKGTKSTTRNPNTWLRGCPIKVGSVSIIGTYHPAGLIYAGFRNSPIFDSDVAKAGRLSRGETTHLVESFSFNPSNQEVREYVEECGHSTTGFGLDIETPIKKESEEEELELSSKEDQHQIDVVGLSVRPGEVVSVRPDQLRLLAPLLDPNTPNLVFAFNGSFDLNELAAHLRIGRGLRLFDPMLGLSLLFSDIRPKDLATAISLFTDLPYTKNLARTDPDRYNAYDTFGALMVGWRQLEMLKDWRLLDLFWKEMEVLPSLNDMKLIGANCDVRLARKFELQCYTALEQYEKWWSANIPNFDWASPKQLVEMFAALGLPIQYEVRIDKNTKERKQTPTANDDALKFYIERHNNSAAKLVRTMRSLKKASDFCHIYDSTGRSHSSYKLHGQVGGRIQSVRPDLQNIPEEIAGIVPRSIIIPDQHDHCFINADFEQIEFWIYAKLANDPILLQAKKEGKYLYGVFYESLFKEPFWREGAPKTKAGMRPDIAPWKLLRAKSLPLGLIYGRVDLTEQELTKSEGDSIKRKFFLEHAPIAEFHASLERQATNFGYLRNPFGRIRRFPNPKGMRNEIFAFPGQSTASDVLRRNALIPLRTSLPDYGGRLVLTVHDQVLVSVPERNLTSCFAHVRDTMQSPIPELQGYFIPVALKVGKSWGELTSLEKFTTAGPTCTV